MGPLKLAEQILLAVKYDQPTWQYRVQLAKRTANELDEALTTDAERKAFWINVYNASAQIQATEHPTMYRLRYLFFSLYGPIVAHKHLSLNHIEHRLLRDGSIPGLPWPRFRGSFDRRFGVDTIDQRIHFGLNCAAASCPPIRFYEPEKIDEQLDIAAEAYLDTGATYDATAEVVTVPRVFKWFKPDFGGADGIYKFLERYDIIPHGERPQIRFDDWNWGHAPNRFA